jgi:hypothetical protein
VHVDFSKTAHHLRDPAPSHWAHRFSSNPFFRDTSPLDRAKPWFQQAIQSFNSRSELISIASLQGSILLSFVAFVEGDFHQEALLAAQAICMVQRLQLPVRLSPDHVEKEVQIRRR